MCLMPRRPPRSIMLRTRWNLSGLAPIRNTTKSPSISAVILRPATFAMNPSLCLVRHRPGDRITALAQAPGERLHRGGGIVGLGDGADHDHAGRAGGEHLVQPVQADAADREPG